MVLRVELRADRGSPALLLLLADVDLGREGALESGHIDARAGVGRHRGEAVEEGRVDGGWDAGVEAVRLRAVQGIEVGRVGRSPRRLLLLLGELALRRRGGRGLHRPGGPESRQRRRRSGAVLGRSGERAP